jgi:hypothetical protein
LVESLELPLVANYIQQKSAAEHSTSSLSSGAVACGEAIKNGRKIIASQTTTTTTTTLLNKFFKIIYKKPPTFSKLFEVGGFQLIDK